MKWNSFLLSLVLATAAIGVRPSPGHAQSNQQNSEARKLFIEGRDLQDDGKLADAEKKFREALTKYPKSDGADRTAYYLISALVKLGRASDARKEIDNFRKNYPQSTWKSDVDEKNLALGGIRITTPLGNGLGVGVGIGQGNGLSIEPLRALEGQLDLVRARGSNVFAVGPNVRTFDYQLSGNASLASEALRMIIEKDAERGIEMSKDRLKVDPSDPAVVANFTSIANSGSAQAVPFFVTVSGSNGSPNVRTQALFWMSRLATDKKDEVTKALMNMLTNAKDKETETAIVNAIVRFNTVERQAVIDGIAQGTSPDRVALLEKLYRSSANNSLRTQIVHALAQVPDAKALAVLTDAAQNDKDLGVRRNAIQAIGGRKDTDVKTLENILKSLPPTSPTPAAVK